MHSSPSSSISVGDVDGAWLGIEEGPSLGNVLGTEDGSSLGNTDRLGAEEESLLGNADRLGTEDGPPLGNLDAAALGLRVIDGASEGSGVASIVGAFVDDEVIATHVFPPSPGAGSS